MTTNNQRLHRILTLFDAERLGEGDLAAGANTLAAMACTLANLHRRGAGLASDGGPPLLVGSSLLATGPLTSSLIQERVTTPLSIKQGNLLGHINEWKVSELEKIERGMKHWGSKSNLSLTPDLTGTDVLSKDSFQRRDCIDRVFSGFVNQLSRALLEQPLIYVTGATTDRLRGNLEKSHLGRPIVYDSLRSPAHCAELGACCLPLIDGSMTTKALGTPVAGHLLLGDPSRVLDEVLRTGSSRWLLRTPWLVDCDVGPKFTPEAATKPVERIERIEACFEAALQEALRKRCDMDVRQPVVHEFPVAKCHKQWVRFLSEQEKLFPGISAAARSLYPTLVFGLIELACARSSPSKIEIAPEDVLVLAAHLIQRMSNAYAAIMHSSDEEAKKRNCARILDRLAEGPHSTRDLGRRFHRITTTECRDLLDGLRRKGHVVQLDGDRWALATGLSLAEPSHLTLNV